jgi:hypothetical protein
MLDEETNKAVGREKMAKKRYGKHCAGNIEKVVNTNN